MNRLKIENGGRPIRNNDLVYLQENEVSGATAMGSAFNATGVAQILSGMDNVSTIVFGGYVLSPDGEIFYHPETDYGVSFNPATYKLDLMSIDEDSRLYKDGVTRNCNTRYYVQLVPVTSVWTQNSVYATAFINRVQLKMYHLLNNKMSINGRDIYANEGIEIQSLFGATGNTNLNRYSGNVGIGLGVYEPIASLEVVGSVAMLNAALTTNSYNWSAGGTTINIAAVDYDRTIYFLSAGSVSNDFDVHGYVGSVMVARTGAYLSSSFLLPAQVAGQIVYAAGTASNFSIIQQKYGR